MALAVTREPCLSQDLSDLVNAASVIRPAGQERVAADLDLKDRQGRAGPAFEQVVQNVAALKFDVADHLHRVTAAAGDGADPSKTRPSFVPSIARSFTSWG
jgi:hypothetical protein